MDTTLVYSLHVSLDEKALAPLLLYRGARRVGTQKVYTKFHFA